MFTVTISRASESLTHMLVGVGPRIVSHRGSATHRSPKVARRLALERLRQAEGGNAGAGVYYRQEVRRGSKVLEVRSA
jgi:hypothetical protein